MKPTVSVIIPTYNRAKFLPVAIESVLNQTYPYVEIIVIDDGSTDNTKAVLEKYKNKIRYLQGVHKGTAFSRNLGMKAATGKYIAFLDSDDSYYPYKLEVQVEFIEAHSEIGMVYSEFSGVFLDGRFDEYHLQNYHPNYKEKGWCYEDLFPVKGTHISDVLKKPIVYYTGDVFRYTLMGTFVSTNTMVFPKKNLAKVGYQNQAYQYGQDYEFSVRMCKHYKVGFLNIPTYKLVYHDKQSTRFVTKETEETVDKQKELFSWIKGWEMFLRTVIDWGYRDKEYYHKNRKFVDSRLKELYCQIGENWLKYGDLKKARTCFQESLKFGTMDQAYRKYYFLSYGSRNISRFVLLLGNKFKKLRLKASNVMAVI